MKKESKDAIKKGLKIGFINMLGTPLFVALFYVMGGMHVISLFHSGFKGPNVGWDLIGLALCIYNTIWLGNLVEIRKEIRAKTLDFLRNDTKTSTGMKKFVADTIFSVYWDELRRHPYESEEQRSKHIEKIIQVSISQYNKGKL